MSLKGIEHSEFLAMAPSTKLMGMWRAVSVMGFINIDMARAIRELADLVLAEASAEVCEPHEVVEARAKMMARPWRPAAGKKRAETPPVSIQKSFMCRGKGRVEAGCHEQEMMKLPACQVWGA